MTLSRRPRGCPATIQLIFEGELHDAHYQAGHTLHIAQNKWSGYAVGLAGESPCYDNGSVCTHNLRQSLGRIKVNSFIVCAFII